MDAPELADRVARIACDKMGEDVAVIDLRGVSSLADFFVLVTANSTVHARALAEAIADQMKAGGERAHHIEGLDHGQWVLLDYITVVVHILLGEVRRFYGFERLWGDAPQRVTAENAADPPDDSSDVPGSGSMT
jgi:ribosome-associated protein